MLSGVDHGKAIRCETKHLDEVRRGSDVACDIHCHILAIICEIRDPLVPISKFKEKCKPSCIELESIESTGCASVAGFHVGFQ